MKRYRCVHCEREVSELMLRTHLVTDHNVAPIELLEKRLDVVTLFARVS